MFSQQDLIFYLVFSTAVVTGFSQTSLPVADSFDEKSFSTASFFLALLSDTKNVSIVLYWKTLEYKEAKGTVYLLPFLDD